MRIVLTDMVHMMAPMGSDKMWIYLLWYCLLLADVTISNNLECCREIRREHWWSRYSEIIPERIYIGLPHEVIGGLGSVGTSW